MQKLLRLDAADITCERGARVLFRGLHCAVESGGALHVRGENGAGKTSLLKIFCGLHIPAHGEVRFNRAPVAKCRDEFHRALMHLGHKPALKAGLTPRENIFASAAIGAREVCAEACAHALRKYGLRHCMHARCESLSAGQLQRVALAALSLQLGGVWILDEPGASLDSAGIALLEEMFNAHVESGGVLIFSSHQNFRLRMRAQILELETFQ